jgi:hypothetical protein
VVIVERRAKLVEGNAFQPERYHDAQHLPAIHFIGVRSDACREPEIVNADFDRLVM